MECIASLGSVNADEPREAIEVGYVCEACQRGGSRRIYTLRDIKFGKRSGCEMGFQGSPVRTEAVHEVMKSRVVTRLMEVAELVDEHVAETAGRVGGEVRVEGDVCRLDVAASPARLHLSIPKAPRPLANHSLGVDEREGCRNLHLVLVQGVDEFLTHGARLIVCPGDALVKFHDQDVGILLLVALAAGDPYGRRIDYVLYREGLAPKWQDVTIPEHAVSCLGFLCCLHASALYPRKAFPYGLLQCGERYLGRSAHADLTIRLDAEIDVLDALARESDLDACKSAHGWDTNRDVSHVGLPFFLARLECIGVMLS